MAKIHGMRQAVLGVAALALGACAFETTSEKREYGQSDSAQSDSGHEACVPTGSCDVYTCGTVPDGCGGQLRCGNPYVRSTDQDYPHCPSQYPYYWGCVTYGPGGPAPYNSCVRSPEIATGWCCTQSA